MIERLHIQNYKALRDVELNLTPIHVLIGPNDSGKTSILEAVTALSRSCDHPLPQAFTGRWKDAELVWGMRYAHPVKFIAEGVNDGFRFEYAITCQFGGQLGVVVAQERLDGGIYSGGPFVLPKQHPQVTTLNRQLPRSENDSDPAIPDAIEKTANALKGVHLYHWLPHHLSLPNAPDKNLRYRMEETGFGLALLLDGILGFDRKRFGKLEERLREVFPDYILSIMLKPEGAYRATAHDSHQPLRLEQAEGKGIFFELKGHPEAVPASQMSDGVLLVLAYLAVLHLPEPPRFLLVEEPENGIHPARLRDVLTILRDLVENQNHTQVIMTTHSPYVVDLFKPNEVTLCRKQDDGSVAVTQLSSSKAVKEQMSVFTLGEIWTGEGDEALAATSESNDEPGA